MTSSTKSVPDDASVIPLDAELRGAIERYYRQQPRTTYDWSKNGALVPIAPRKAPRLVFEAIAEALESSIPAWLPALHCCELKAAEGGRGFFELRPEAVFAHVVTINRLAHEEGAPEELRFYTGGSAPVLKSVLYGFDPAPRSERNPSLLVRYQHTAGSRAVPPIADPAIRITRIDPIALVNGAYHGYANMLEPGADEYSRETIASIQEVLRKPAPRFELSWEDRTKPYMAPRPEAPPAAPAIEPLPERLLHPKFGVGEVVSREGTGDATKYVLDFQVGRKTIVARFLSSAD